MPRGPLLLLQWYTLQESHDRANPNAYVWSDDNTEGPSCPREVIQDIEKRYNDYDKDGDVHATSKMWIDNKLGPLLQTVVWRVSSLSVCPMTTKSTPHAPN